MPDENQDKATWRSPLATRWATPEMLENFSDLKKFRTWRRLWIALAEAEKALGLGISDDQIEEMKRHRDDVNFDVADARERQVRHDVMAHVHAFGEQCPAARPIIHLGATSCYVADNTDLILMRDALGLVRDKLVNLIDCLGAFAEEHGDLPCLGFTHLQPAQLTTVGKRACLWLQDFVMDLEEVETRVARIRFRGVKGATGTQASFLQLFGGDHEKVKTLERMVAEAMGFGQVFPATGQTYTRKLDSQVLAALSGMAQSAHKFANDIRFLHTLHEVEEPFKTSQIGSSAMAYKRNPMRCERITGLARFVICTAQNAPFTAASQWLERTLDDSANRRLSLPESFIAADALLHIALNVAGGLVVRPKMIARHVARELPFIATEAILMEAVNAGGDRQEMHEHIRRHAVAAAEQMKEEGEANDLMERIAADPAFALVRDRLADLTRPERFVGRAPEQVAEFLQSVVQPIREKYASALGMRAELKV